MTGTTPAWVPAGTAFDADDFVYYRDKGRRPVGDVLGEIDLVLTGPHASAAFPEEMAPYVAEGLTCRLQHDFTDVSTSPVGRRWAEIDPHVLYVENPHPRAVRDANRARPDDLGPGLREAFARLRQAGETAAVPDWGRRRPTSDVRLPPRAARATERGPVDCVDRRPEHGGIIGRRRVRAGTRRSHRANRERQAGAAGIARCRRPDRERVAIGLHAARDVAARHDEPHGTIRRGDLHGAPASRSTAERRRLSNHGGPDTGVRASTTGVLLDDEDVLSLDPATMRAIANAYRWAFDAYGPDNVAFNRPYLGGFETRHIAPWLRSRAPQAVVSCDGVPVALHLGAWQNEFLREFLLGPDATDHLMTPGEDWVMPPDDRVTWLAERLRAAHDRSAAGLRAA